MFKKKPPEEEPNVGPLSFPAGYKFPKDLPKVDALVLDKMFEDMEAWRKVAK